jgi:hypothetical protein
MIREGREGEDGGNNRKKRRKFGYVSGLQTIWGGGDYP